MSEIRIVLPAPSPSQNDFHHVHWTTEHKSKKEWASLILGSLPAPKSVLAAKGKRRMRVERHGKKRLDPANLYGGLKGILDNLVEFGILVDDDEDHLELSAVNVKLERGEAPHTVLILQDC